MARVWYLTLEDECEDGKSSGYAYSVNWINPESSIAVREVTPGEKSFTREEIREVLNLCGAGENFIEVAIDELFSAGGEG
jgi:hypothetical protein